MNPWIFNIEYTLNGTDYRLSTGDIKEIHAHTPLRITADISDQTLAITTTADCPYEITSCSFVLTYPFNKTTTTYLNGFQSWTDSKEHFSHEREFGIHPLFMKEAQKRNLDKYGGTHIYDIKRNRGHFHGYTYMYVRNSDILELFGSLSERDGFTIFDVEMKQNKITIIRDCANVSLTGTYQLFNIKRFVGSYNNVFDCYFEAMHIKKPTVPRMNGWTSWYNYYQNINDKIITHNMNYFIDNEIPIDIFQIDDGYQQFVGDWLFIDEAKFPEGMAKFPKQLHTKNIKAGIWLAPFVAEGKSALFNNHPDWFLRDENGEFVCAGFNWSNFYPLDIYNPEVQNYLKNVFNTIFQEWQYDMVKLDFLYAACLGSRKDKTRGQVMVEAMEMLREWIGPGLILGCGVPLGPAFGNVDFCRIGCDIGLDWNDKWWMRYLHRERISTKNALTNTLGRFHLTNRAFMNDPDVFLLRDENIQLSPSERKLLTDINRMFGDLIFTSDDLASYTTWQKELFTETMNANKCDVTDIKLIQTDVYHIHLKDNTQYYVNLQTRAKKINNTRIPAKTIMKLETR